MHALPAALVSLVWLALAPGARDRVALVRADGDEGLAARLEAELRAQGYEVVGVAAEPAGTAPVAALERALAVAGAGAAVRVDSVPGALRVWVVNGVTGKQIFREVAPDDRERVDRAVVALFAVELLRASAIERPAPPPPAPPRAVGVALEVAPAVALSPGGLGAAFDVMIGARWQRGAHAGLEALLLVPTLPARLTGAGGVALVSIGLLGAGAYATTGGARWSAQAAAGAAVALVHATGDAADTYLGRTDQAFAGGPYARVGGAVRVSGWLRLRADAAAGALLPRPVVAFDQSLVASWGRPWVALIAGVEATF